jgi:hypothetical protein
VEQTATVGRRICSQEQGHGKNHQRIGEGAEDGAGWTGRQVEQGANTRLPARFQKVARPSIAGSILPHARDGLGQALPQLIELRGDPGAYRNHKGARQKSEAQDHDRKRGAYRQGHPPPENNRQVSQQHRGQDATKREQNQMGKPPDHQCQGGDEERHKYRPAPAGEIGLEHGCLVKRDLRHCGS